MDSNKLYEALGNEKNEHIITTNFEEIEIEKNKILEELPLSEDDYIHFYEKLKDFKYCASSEHIYPGGIIIWISLHNKENKLILKHGRVAKTYETQDDINILYFVGGRLFTIKYSEIIIFQKITEQEKTILQLIGNIQ
jgi:hypothetical protein